MVRDNHNLVEIAYVDPEVGSRKFIAAKVYSRSCEIVIVAEPPVVLCAHWMMRFG